MQQATEAMEDMHRLFAEQEKSSKASDKLRNAAALIAADAINELGGKLRDRALAMARAIARFCDEYDGLDEPDLEDEDGPSPEDEGGPSPEDEDGP
ncbi:MAG: hypothetical protein KAJ19_20605 [Gammaproteobacteria bacterium]|nr:hypothetical protein [Gammaproteobacteria bacterium]